MTSHEKPTGSAAKAGGSAAPGRKGRTPWAKMDVNEWTPRIDFAGPIELVLDDGQVLRIEPSEEGFTFQVLPPLDDDPSGAPGWNEGKRKPRSGRHMTCPYTGRKVLRYTVALRQAMLADLEIKKKRSKEEYVGIGDKVDPTLRRREGMNLVRRELMWAADRYARHGLKTQEEVYRQSKL